MGNPDPQICHGRSNTTSRGTFYRALVAFKSCCSFLAITAIAVQPSLNYAQGSSVDVLSDASIPALTVSRIGGNAQRGTGGYGGSAGEGGDGGGYLYVGEPGPGHPGAGWLPQPGHPGEQGHHGGNGGTGGRGGNGSLILEGMSRDDALFNYGTLVLGGNPGATGAFGQMGYSRGGRGGDGGAGLGWAETGAEPSPDPIFGIDAGSGGGTLENGGAGMFGAGGGGGGDGGFWLSTIILFPPPAGYGGHGGAGFDGRAGLGGTGASGAHEVHVQTTSAYVPMSSVVRLGGDGGQGGNGGDGGSGGGGGGGAGALSVTQVPILWVFSYGPQPGGAGGAPGFPGYGGAGGAAGKGTLVVGDRGTLINEASGKIELTAGSGSSVHVDYGGRMVNHGLVDLADSRLELGRGAIIENDGQLLSLSAPIASGIGSTVVNDGLLVTTVFENNGYLSGTGTIIGDVTNFLEFSPGDSVGEFTIDGNYTEYLRFNAEIAGRDQYDILNVGGDLSFASFSSLRLSFIDGFSEASLVPGDAFDLIHYSGDISGEFGTVDSTGAQLAFGNWELTYDHVFNAQWRSVRLTYAVIPIPASAVLFATALTALGMLRRRGLGRITTLFDQIERRMR